MELKIATMNELDIAMGMIDMAKKHLREQGIDQWQTGYPDSPCLKNDILNQKGYFVMEEEAYLGYLCIDFGGEPAYANLNGDWASDEDYVVVHRMAFSDQARGKKLATKVFSLVEQLGLERNVHCFRVDTDEANGKMKHILQISGFTYRGTIWFDSSEKIAFDKSF